jgi:ABC-type branched-subunit amino acid transport system ATPase component
MKEIMTELIQDVHQRGMTIVMIEHDMQFVMGISNSVVVLNFGEKIAEGVPEEITRNTRVIEAYLGNKGL